MNQKLEEKYQAQAKVDSTKILDVDEILEMYGDKPKVAKKEKNNKANLSSIQ